MSYTVLALLLGLLSWMGGTSAIAAAEEACLDEWESLELNDTQWVQLEQLEAQLDEQIDTILPISMETERQIEQLEEGFEETVESLFSDGQLQQLEQLDEWIDNQEYAIAPELWDDEEARLTAEQYRQLETLWAEYERRFQAIVTAEQAQRMALLEEQLDEAIEAILPEPTTNQERQIEAVEADFEQQFYALLSPAQRQQWEVNEACYEAEAATL
ncbi:MAG: hypothetical protein F6K00_01435 [Leptolyngbya sp. SIOISBB]|nr:hypothetical protein [Leptolyngbya sp. SIOISBB]